MAAVAFWLELEVELDVLFMVKLAVRVMFLVTFAVELVSTILVEFI